jgi:hypothetical protein
MTINQVSKIYAGDYRWGKIVAKTLGVSPTITLAEYFAATEVPEAPQASDDSIADILNLGLPFDQN